MDIAIMGQRIKLLRSGLKLNQTHLLSLLVSHNLHYIAMRMEMLHLQPMCY